MGEEKVYCKNCNNLTEGYQTRRCKIKTTIESWYEKEEILEFPKTKNKNNNCKDFSPKVQGDG